MQIRRRVLDAWLHDLRVGWGERAERSVSAITPVIARGQLGDLHTIGHQLATDGHQLDDTLAWFRLLASQSRPFRHLLERGGIINLASGWADGVLHHDFTPLTTGTLFFDFESEDGWWLARGTVSASEVAYLVGFTEPPAFFKAFKRWTGMTPRAFQQGAGAG